MCLLLEKIISMGIECASWGMCRNVTLFSFAQSFPYSVKEKLDVCAKRPTLDRYEKYEIMPQQAYLPRGANPHGIHLDQVVQNANDESIDLSEIALLYRDLTDTELFELKRHSLYVDESSTTVRGRFTKEGLVLYPDKVFSLLHL